MKRYLLGFGLSTVLCWAAFLLIVALVRPDAGGWQGIAGFYTTLFFACVGTFTLIGYRLRRWATKRNVLFAHLTPSLRQGTLLSIALVASLALQQTKLLTWWNATALVAAILLAELFFQSRRNAPPTAMRA